MIRHVQRMVKALDKIGADDKEIREILSLSPQSLTNVRNRMTPKEWSEADELPDEDSAIDGTLPPDRPTDKRRCGVCSLLVDSDHSPCDLLDRG